MNPSIDRTFFPREYSSVKLLDFDDFDDAPKLSIFDVVGATLVCVNEKKKNLCVRKDCMQISLSVLFVLTLVSSAVGVEDVHPIVHEKRQPDVSICDDVDLFVAVATLLTIGHSDGLLQFRSYRILETATHSQNKYQFGTYYFKFVRT